MANIRREFDNTDYPLPDGSVARIGTHVGPNGEMTIKLRLPSDYWAITGVFRAAESPRYATQYKKGKTVITIDKK
jgi:hypothetical protein